MSQKLLVETLDEDRFARATQITLGEKTIQTPSFCTLVQNTKEFNSLMRLSLLTETRHLGSYVIRVFDALDTIIPRLQNQAQVDLIDRKYACMK